MRPGGDGDVLRNTCWQRPWVSQVDTTEGARTAHGEQRDCSAANAQAPHRPRTCAVSFEEQVWKFCKRGAPEMLQLLHRHLVSTHGILRGVTAEGEDDGRHAVCLN